MVNLNSGAIDSGEPGDPILGVVTKTDKTAYRTVKVLPGETVADVARRIFGANTELNRDRIRANNESVQEGPISVVNG